jgi:hypothetical protein
VEYSQRRNIKHLGEVNGRDAVVRAKYAELMIDHCDIPAIEMACRRPDAHGACRINLHCHPSSDKSWRIRLIDESNGVDFDARIDLGQAVDQ